MIYIWNFHVLSNLLLIYTCKLHWIQYSNHMHDKHHPDHPFIDWDRGFTADGRYLYLKKGTNPKTGLKFGLEHSAVRCAEIVKAGLASHGKSLMIYIWNFHVLSNLLLIYICKLHWNLNTMFVCQVNPLWFTYEISMS